MSEPPRTVTPAWVPLPTAARALGLRPRLARTAIEIGQVPARIARFGTRGLVHVNAADLDAYLQLQRAASIGAIQ